MGRFLLGFAIGVLLGAVVVILAGPRSGPRKGVGALLDGALTAARRASSLREQELWDDYRARIKQGGQPKPAPKQPWEPYER